MEKETITAKINDYFTPIEEVLTVYLFGSIVKGKNNKNSDVDIALLFSDKISIQERFEKKLEFAMDLENVLNKKVDIVDLSEADLYFVHQVMLNKEIILDKDIHYRVSFEVARRKSYFDRKPFYDLYHNHALKRLERGL
jgi:predicted nucleotidyltransferase